MKERSKKQKEHRTALSELVIVTIAEDFEQAAHLILQIHAFAEHRSATAEQHSDVMTLDTFHMHLRLIP